MSPASKETLFRFGEALAAAGFECVAVDLPGHGESPLSFARNENARTLETVARTIGSVDVFVGYSMGAYAGAEAVRHGRLRPRLFIAVGALSDVGEEGSPLLLLAGRFDEAIPLALLKARRNAHPSVGSVPHFRRSLADLQTSLWFCGTMAAPVAQPFAMPSSQGTEDEALMAPVHEFSFNQARTSV